MGRQDGESECLLNKERRNVQKVNLLMQSLKMEKRIYVFFFFLSPATESAGGLGLCRVFVAACRLLVVARAPLVAVSRLLIVLAPWHSTGARRVGFCGCSKWTQQLWLDRPCCSAVPRSLPNSRTGHLSPALQADSHPLHRQQSPRKVLITDLMSFNWQCSHADFVSPSFLFPSPSSSLCPGVISKQAHLPMTRHSLFLSMDCW